MSDPLNELHRTEAPGVEIYKANPLRSARTGETDETVIRRIHTKGGTADECNFELLNPEPRTARNPSHLTYVTNHSFNCFTEIRVSSVATDRFDLHRDSGGKIGCRLKCAGVVLVHSTL
jgi:hypothetical protein